MELREFAEKVIEVDVEWMGETVTMGIRPGYWTNERVAELSVPLPSDDEERARLIGMWVGLIATWDITEKGKPLPITAANIAKLPQMLFASIPEAFADKIRAEGKT